MGLFGSDKSWTNQAKNTGNQSQRGGGLFGGNNLSQRAARAAKAQKAAAKANKARRRCPPVKDCAVKQSLMASAAEQRRWGVQTKKEVREAKAKADKVAKQQKAARARGRSGGSWPNAGKYDPKGQQKSKGFFSW